jgi:nicotinamidase-related amidase
MRLSSGFLAGGAVVLALTAQAAETPDIMREWATIKAPAPPTLRPVTVDAAKTALLVMDFSKMNCVPERRARCVPAAAKVRSLLDAARAHHVLVVHVINTAMKPTDIVDALQPVQGETVIQVQGDKFHASELENLLKDRGITTVIATGSSGNGAVLLTTIGGASRGFQMIVPVDTLPSDSAYHEQLTIAEIASVGFVNERSTITRSDMIRF